MLFYSNVLTISSMYVTTHNTSFSFSKFLSTQPLSFSLKFSKSVPISIFFYSKPSTAPTSDVSPIKYLFVVCRCTSYILLQILFTLLFTLFVSLTSPPRSGVGVVPSSSLLALEVSPEPLICISCLYLFDLSIFVRFLVSICSICRNLF